MTNDLMNLIIGQHTVAENLERTVASGRLVRHESGLLELPVKQSTRPNPWLHHQVALKHLDCQFLNDFLFKSAYARSAAPFGCRDCYKVKVIPRTLRGLDALWQIVKRIECLAKCGTEVDNPYSQNLYAGFFYTLGLAKAREIYHIVRREVDEEQKLGPEVPMVIKRGCTRHEILCGPSDKYQYQPELPALEEFLKSRFRRRASAETNEQDDRRTTLWNWIATAYRVGDETYLDFTGGRPLYPKTVTYPVLSPPDE
ncbi:MAG: hypothetical protein HQK58_18060 [Deltaproteobacteria bacterium]|nr:hypothetical protein [Deltaproteobacteria bacterium]